MPKAGKATGRRVVANKLDECLAAVNECIARQERNESDISTNKQLVETLAVSVSQKADKEYVHSYVDGQLNRELYGYVGSIDTRIKDSKRMIEELASRVDLSGLTFIARLRWLLTGRVA